MEVASKGDSKILMVHQICIVINPVSSTDDQVTRDIHGSSMNIPSDLVICRYTDRVGVGYMCTSMD